MKKALLFTVSFIFIASLVQAQINKGTVLLGGNLSASTYKYNTASSSGSTDFNTHQNGFFFYPSLGFATNQNKVWGFMLGYNYSKSKSSSAPGEQKSNGYGAGVYHRRYLPLGKSFYLFGQTGIYYYHSYQKTDNDNTYNETKSSGLSVSVYPGIAYAVNKRIHLEVGINELASLGFSHTSYKNGVNNGSYTTQKSNGFGLSTNLSSSNPLMVGFRFVLGK